MYLSFQQTKPAVHKLLGARVYDPRVKRPKLKPTDRRLTVTVNDDEYAAAGDVSLRPPQTVDEMRRMRNQRLWTEQRVITPYVGKRTSVAVTDSYQLHTSATESEHCLSAVAVSTTGNCIASTGHTTASCDTISKQTCAQSVKHHAGSHGLDVKLHQNEAVLSADTNRLPKEKLVQYISAIG